MTNATETVGAIAATYALVIYLFKSNGKGPVAATNMPRNIYHSAAWQYILSHMNIHKK